MQTRLKHRSLSILEAVQQNNLAKVRRLIAAGADVNACDTQGLTTLMHAAAKGRTGIVRLLLKHGADSSIAVSYHSTNWTSATAIAAYHGHLNVVRLLLRRNGKRATAEWNWSQKYYYSFHPNIKGKKKGLGQRSTWHTQQPGSKLPLLNFVALLAAAEENRTAVVALLRPCGNYGFHETKVGSNWFVQAVQHDALGAAKFYLQLGVEVDTPSTWEQEETAMIMAARNGNIEMAELLLSYGANVNAPTEYGYTPLMEAAQEGQIEMIRWLLVLCHGRTLG